LPDLCRDNATQIYQTLNDMFKWNYKQATSDITLALDISNLMKAPYGLCFSCYFAFVNYLLYTDDSMGDPKYDPDGSMANKLVIIN
jgi:hypothetical protein